MRILAPWALAFVLLAGCSKAPEPPISGTPAAKPVAAVEWIRPLSVADADRAFELAKTSSQPVFLFWTAEWCPPCNQVKATIFTRPDFIAKSRAFVPLYVDADSPAGQALAQRFNVSFYPTMVLLTPDGQEVTRLAGSVDAAKYMQLLGRALTAGLSARQALDEALSGKSLSAEDWRMLAYYDWMTDEGQLVPEGALAATLLRLAAACPAAQQEASSRLVLQALTATAEAKGTTPELDKADAIDSVRSLLAQPQLVRDNNDLLGLGAADIVGLLTVPKSPERKTLVEQWNAALDRLAGDPAVSNSGRMYAMLGKVELTRLNNKDGPLPAALTAEVRAQAARVDRETTSQDERQAVITLTGAVLARAGLLDESDALLSIELERSHSSYYYMSQLASNAKRRGTPNGKTSALEWSRLAYATAQGTATRLRWGGSYVAMLIELAPNDAAAIEKAALRVIAEVDADALTGNNRKGLERMSTRLVAWNKDGRYDAVLGRLHDAINAKCPAIADWCDALFEPAKRA